jgi:hypothetical protein
MRTESCETFRFVARAMPATLSDGLRNGSGSALLPSASIKLRKLSTGMAAPSFVTGRAPTDRR